MSRWKKKIRCVPKQRFAPTALKLVLDFERTGDSGRCYCNVHVARHTNTPNKENNRSTVAFVGFFISDPVKLVLE